MSDIKYDGILLIDEALQPAVTLQEANALKPLQKQFVESYIASRDTADVREWLRQEMAHSLPEYDSADTERMADEIIDTLQLQEEKRDSLRRATQNGRSREGWFSSELKRAASQMTTQQSVQYLQTLDQTVKQANQALTDTIHTQTGAVSNNPSLDGFIAEQKHAQSFNMNAIAKGSPYRAKVLEPTGHGYAKNSVDVVIVDGNDTVVRRYQSKYCKDTGATAKAFADGDYRGQQKLIPEEQAADFPKKATTVLEAPDGTTSEPLSKAQAKQLQQEAQSGRWSESDWNDYRFKDVAMGIGKETGASALFGVAVGAGTSIIRQAWNEEEIDGGQVVEDALTAGADFGVKAAMTGAVKVAAEKGIISAIPKGTPAGTIANIVHVGVENIKIAGKMATGELTLREGIDQLEQTTVSTIAGIAGGAKGATLGAEIGMVCGPVDAAVGGLIGGAVGYIGSSALAQGAVKVVQKVRDTVADGLSRAAEKVSDFVGGIRDGLCSLFG